MSATMSPCTVALQTLLVFVRLEGMGHLVPVAMDFERIFL